MFCLRLEAEISAEDCNKTHDNDCYEKENYEPFIWFMLREDKAIK